MEFVNLTIIELDLNQTFYLDQAISCELPFDLSTYNFSQHDFPKAESILINLNFVHYFLIFISLSIIIVAVFGNLAVLFAVFRNRSMRHTINFYLANLAAADLLIAICCVPVYLINNLTDPFYVLGSVMCKLNPFTQMTSLTSSVLTLCAISCDRFMAIMFPFLVRVTKIKAKLVIASIWLLSVFVSSPFLFVRKQYKFEWNNMITTSCIETWPQYNDFDTKTKTCITNHPEKKLYYTFITVALFFVPIIIMTTVSILIIRKLWINRAPGEDHPCHVGIQHRNRQRVIKMVCIVLLAFTFCWAPLQILLLYSVYFHSSGDKGELPYWFQKISHFAHLMAFLNSALNPIIYNSTFRIALRSLIACDCTGSSIQTNAKSLPTPIKSDYSQSRFGSTKIQELSIRKGSVIKFSNSSINGFI